jgi:NAD(P)-dependent dehydrogenase (short-subunit alcohol dehydrogenase family)
VVLQNRGIYNEESIAVMHPMRRMEMPEDIANGIDYLDDGTSPFMTSTILFVDGGYKAW